ncbi:hypothetical protein Q8F55_003017 [Vanrija albida]|uniref:TFIIS N-terminal domain-containing protein n=1 Tax=Vanrija albida TaxID=181172 RepID=A0ABR3QBC9_9TREE
MDAWVTLQQYATSPDQLAWLQREFIAHPPLPQQTVDDWLLWRSRVAEGLTELEALSTVLNQTQHPASFPASLAIGQPEPLPLIHSVPFIHPPQPQQHLVPPPVQFDPAQQFLQFDPSSFGTAGLPQPPHQQVHHAYTDMNQVSAINFQQHPGPSVHAYAQQPQTFVAPGFVQQAQQPPVLASSSHTIPNTTPMASPVPPSAIPPPTQPSSQAPSFIAPPAHLQKPPPPSLGPPQPLARETQPAPSTLSGTKRQRPALSRRRIMHSPLPPFKDTWIVPVGYDMAKGASVAARKPDSSKFDDEPIQVDRPAASSSSASAAPAQPRPSGTFIEVLKAVRPELLKLNKPGQLFKFLRYRRDADGSELKPLLIPNSTELAEIMTKLDAASQSYLRVMADDYRHSEMFEIWMKKMAKNPKEWEPAIGPLLRVLNRTDMPVNFIKKLKIGKLALAIRERSRMANLASAAKIQLQVDKYERYCKESLLPKNREVPLSDSDSDSDSDGPAAKKRKTGDVKPTIKSAPSSSSARPAAASSKPSAKPAPKPASAKADMSFFGGGASASSSNVVKPKPKLPDFKRNSVPPPAPVASSSGSSLLASTMRMLKKEESPPTRVESRPSPAPQPVVPRADPSKPKLNKKGHLVRWVDLVPSPPPGRELNAIRLFKQEPHELEPAPWQEEGDVHGMSAHDLDKQEGRAMRVHDGIEEVVDWFEPSPYLDPETLNGPLFTDEVREQDERERPIMAVSYPAGATPPTPDEAGVRHIATGDGTASHVLDKTLYGGAPAPAVAPAAPAVSSNVQDLLRSLSGAIPQVAQPAAPASYGYDQYGAHQGYGAGSSATHEQRWQQQQHQPVAAPPTANRWNNNGNSGYNNGAGSGYNAPAGGNNYGSTGASNYGNNSYGDNRGGYGRGGFNGGNRAAPGAHNYRKRPYDHGPAAVTTAAPRQSRWGVPRRL